MIKPMLPTLVFEAPRGSDWVYEIKYDGFRALLHWNHHSVELISRNGNNLNEQFPDIIEQCHLLSETFSNVLPIIFDGELCILESNQKASFEQIQQRGRLKNRDKIEQSVKQKNAFFLIFDLLSLKGEPLSLLPFHERKQKLLSLFENKQLVLDIDYTSQQLLQLIQSHHDFDSLWKTVKEAHGEGIIAKKQDSKWEAGKRTTSWLKIKNWLKGNFFITGFDKSNSFFHVSVVRNNEIYEIGLFSHGLSPEEREALLMVVQNNRLKEEGSFIRVSPGICVELNYLELYKEQLRQPSFSKFQLDLNWKECTWEKLQQKIKLPSHITISHPDKPLWKDKDITKQTYLDYLLAISPYMLPFLKNRYLTVIRYPHGMYGEPFYQKNCPDYAPDFIKRKVHDGIDYIICNDVDTLAWLGNQLAFEFHIPFSTFMSNGPSEIVFDLDPPSRKEFSLAIKAALILKEVFEGLKLISFIKLSGNKGLQIYLPLPENTFTYDDTRTFTEFIANYLVTKEPNYFTTERLKKNRGNRLYVDYIQHAEGKTIIAPYSVRGNEGAYVAAPLFWSEVNEDLTITPYSLENIVPRVTEKGCPFSSYFQVKDIQPFQPVLDFLRNK